MPKRTSPWHDPDRRREYRKKNRARILHRVRVRDYGISSKELKQLEEEHGGKCAICKRERPPLCLDHDHETGRVRGLLCRKCNAALGFLDDDPDLVFTAAMYLMGY